MADRSRNGTLAEYVAVEARNLAPLPVGVDHAVASGAVISGLTAWRPCLLVTIAEPPTIQPQNGRAIFFVVEADRSQLGELGQRLRDGRLTSNVRTVRPLAEAPTAFGPDAPRGVGKTIIQVTEGWSAGGLDEGRRCRALVREMPWRFRGRRGAERRT